MDIALAVEEIYPVADYRRSESYEALVRTWKDKRAVPTEEELEAAWERVQTRQAAEAEQQRQLEQTRADNATPIVTDDYAGESALLQVLARKIAWLEQEIAELRG